MEYITGITAGRLELFFLVLVRVSMIFLITPIFGRRNLPSLLKAGFAFVLSVIMVSTVDARPYVYQGFGDFTIDIAIEMAVGFLIGFVTYIIFSAIYVAGQVIDMETGLGIVNVIDPQGSMQVPIMGNFMYIVALWVFMALDGHYMLISAVYNSFELLPPGVGIEWQKTAVDLTSIVAHTFIIGFKISAPIVTAILLADVGLGILSRTMPQMNAFVIGIPVKILVGMTAMMMLLPMFTSILDNMLVFLNQSLIRVLTNTR